MILTVLTPLSIWLGTREGANIIISKSVIWLDSQLLRLCYGELCYFVIVLLICFVNRWPSAAAWAGFPPNSWQKLTILCWRAVKHQSIKSISVISLLLCRGILIFVCLHWRGVIPVGWVQIHMIHFAFRMLHLTILHDGFGVLRSATTWISTMLG